MTTAIDNSQDYIDSRNVIARIDSLKSARLDAEEIGDMDRVGEIDEELEPLNELASQCEGYSEDWPDGAQLIRESVFRDYAEELAEDIGAINKNLEWPLNCINWDEAADQLKQDYTEVDFDGVTYFVR